MVLRFFIWLSVWLNFYINFKLYRFGKSVKFLNILHSTHVCGLKIEPTLI